MRSKRNAGTKNVVTSRQPWNRAAFHQYCDVNVETATVAACSVKEEGSSGGGTRRESEALYQKVTFICIYVQCVMNITNVWS